MHRTLISLFLLLSMTSIAHADLRNGLVGWWRFDEASGNAIDWCGQNNNGTPTGTTIVKNCKRSGCRQFNGSSDFVDLGNGGSLNPAAISISAWVNFNSLSNAYTAVVSKVSNQASAFYQLFVKSSGKLAAYIGTAGGNKFYDGTGTYTLTTGTWYHLVMVYSSSVGIIGYVNASQDQTVVPAAALSGNNIAVATIGKDTATAGRFMNGMIDDVRIYNRVLSSQEVSDLYRSGVVIRNAVIRNARINQ